MTMRSSRSFVLGVTITMFGLGASPAHADALIDFGTGTSGRGGTIGYAGGLSPLVGTNIRIGVVTGVDTPVNSDAHSVIGNLAPYGVVNFTTGAFQNYSGGLYRFGGGGTFQLFGNVPDAGIYESGPGALLFSGVFQSATIGKLGSLDLFSASGVDFYEHPQLLSFFGLPLTTYFEFSSYVTATGAMGTGTPFSVTAFSTDWANPDPPLESAQQATTPEPASLVLFGSGLTLLGRAIRQRRCRLQNHGRQTSAA